MGSIRITALQKIRAARFAGPMVPISVIQCGGTIDKEYPRSVGGYHFEYGPDGPSGAERILTAFDLDYTFDFHKCCLKDGADLTTTDYESIVSVIRESEAQHFIVTHDTAAIESTAAAVFELMNKQRVRDKVVAFVCSSLPECFEQSDAPLHIGMALGACPLLKHGVHTFGAMASSTSLLQADASEQPVVEAQNTEVFNQTIKVEAGKYRTLQVPLAGPGEVCWECQVDQKDCQVTVYFKRPGTKDPVGAEVEIRAATKYSGKSEHKWQCPAAGELVLVLDNNSAWYNTRTVHLTVQHSTQITIAAAAAPEDDSDIDAFTTAVRAKPHQHPDATAAIKLQLHGFYKQAVTGPCTVVRPGGFNLSGKNKWDAWNTLGDMSKEQAKAAFVELCQRELGIPTIEDSIDAEPIVVTAADF